jgi:hypothetical protein
MFIISLYLNDTLTPTLSQRERGRPFSLWEKVRMRVSFAMEYVGNTIS